ncbi:DUF1517 domain-containing protein [Cyanobium sp. Cruz CV13-4-11]|jgi:uncharacterized membrane protein|uniref:DUF1517 domain-containing protein n=1 Tax=unclassified Cyanobium TaxID=2627006 RepID=UPI0020CEACCC|nr:MULTISPECIES: DUF1517 domain-containing protein [unclassified Cyanobium]MCP9900218.1 DUF1517 domain-containing protein [Cyanobium sp. Cruz CV11-17]MCP9918531.1 DUF1517 domain-containing protein [Cyanobium sp. Cruz CV13-4-11]
MGSSLFRRLAGLMVVPVLVAGLVMAAAAPAQAASGGRIGGGSFRSAPSMPRSFSGGGSGGNFGGGGFRGGGMGFPFIVPIFGFGGGGLFGFLILMAVAGVVVNALRGGGGGPALGGSGSDLAYNPRPDGPVAIAQIQVGLLASARDLQDDLRRLAGSSDTSSSAGLQRVLQETSLSLLRHPDLWVYANGDVGQVPFSSAESTFNRLSMQERSKLERELTANVAGRRFSEPATVAPGASDAASDFIVVTLLIASRQRLAIKGARSAEDLRDSLQKLGAIGADDLLALEVIWQPEGAGEVLSTEQVITAYPDLQHL